MVCESSPWRIATPLIYREQRKARKVMFNASGGQHLVLPRMETTFEPRTRVAKSRGN
jgi:hypothetical protein